MQYIETTDEAQTIAVARDFARQLKSGDVVAFYGDLGAGKSVFCRSIIRTLCEDDGMEVPSPTYTIVQSYESDYGVIWHFDLYRLGAPEEIYEIGWEEALANGIMLVEWPSRLGKLLPARRIDVTLSGIFSDPNRRKIEIIAHDISRDFTLER